MISLCCLILILSYSAASKNSTVVLNSTDSTNVVQVSELPDGALTVNINGSHNNILFLSSDNIAKLPQDIEKDNSTGNNNNGNNDNNGDNNEGNNANKTVSSKTFSDCSEATKRNGKSGVYNIEIAKSKLQFKAYCMVDPNGGKGWTIIQRRQDGYVEFNQNWKTYESGFGDLNADYFLGLKAIHALTNGPLYYELWVELRDASQNKSNATYGIFSVGGAEQKYVLKATQYNGNAGDALRNNWNAKFSTKDMKNDGSFKHCALVYRSGWWFARSCFHSSSNLNGDYDVRRGFGGVDWYGRYRSLKYAHMAIRPTDHVRIIVGDGDI